MNDVGYKTDYRLWLKITLLLFLIIGLLPVIGTKGESMRPVVWIWEFFRGVITHEMDWRSLKLGALLLIFYVSIFAIPSVVFAWLIQCAVVMVRSKRS